MRISDWSLEVCSSDLVLGGNPIFLMRAAARRLDPIAVEIGFQHLETRHIAAAARTHIPVARDLDRIILGCHRIEDRLLRQTRRKCAHAAFADQRQFCEPYRAPTGDRRFGHHTTSSNRSACARASAVTSAPESMRAISSRRPAGSRARTPVRVTVPSLDLAMTKCAEIGRASCRERVCKYV